MFLLRKTSNRSTGKGLFFTSHSDLAVRQRNISEILKLKYWKHFVHFNLNKQSVKIEKCWLKTLMNAYTEKSVIVLGVALKACHVFLQIENNMYTIILEFYSLKCSLATSGHLNDSLAVLSSTNPAFLKLGELIWHSGDCGLIQ